MLIETLLVASILLQNAPPLQPLTDQQVTDAVEMGRAGDVPLVQVGTFLGVSKGNFNVFVEGPMARIAAEASKALRQYRPFGQNNVTNDMKAPLYRIFVERASGSAGAVEHIVLQARGATGLDGVLQPVKEPRLGGGAYFDRLPDTDFDVVVATTSGTQRYNVSANDRAKIERAAGVMSPARSVNASAGPSAPTPAPARSQITGLRLYVQGDSKHIAEAIQGLQSELGSAGISGGVVPRGEPYDYTIIFGEGSRNAAAAIALDSQGNVVAIVVKGALTEKGAAEGAARDLGKKLAALSR